ncbi:hypothetical protein C8R43DRAFT_823951, partial [Mycena crocata]
KALPKSQRPAEVGWWVQRARKPTPVVQNTTTFTIQWQNWWRAINPEWRNVGGTGSVLPQEEGRDWDVLNVTGINGFLSVVMTLRWWRLGLGEGAVADWAEAVSDVTWAMKEIAK